MMKKVALTVAVLALGLAACEDNAPDNATSTVNTVEMEANADTAAAANAVDNALDATENAADNAADATDNAADATENAAENAAQ
ncbi:circumsporozoite protein [Sphingomonas sp. HDW15A]|nr:circumsporozoite protein [Sphingomonas sp. HDW15A]